MAVTVTRRWLSAREVLDAASRTGARVTRARLLYAARKGAVMPPEKVARNSESPRWCWLSDDLAGIVSYFERKPCRLNSRPDDPPRFLPGQTVFPFLEEK